MSDLPELDPADVVTCLRVLRRLALEPGLCDGVDPALSQVRQDAARFLDACKQLRRRQVRQRDRDLLDNAEIRIRPAASAGSVKASPVMPAASAVVSEGRTCYVCKQPYQQLHSFYDCLCVSCGEFNDAKRHQTADLTGRVALLTGGRVKIGFATALKMLRAGARVLVTTRFPRDAARRYVREADFSDWAERLQIHALDMRDLPSVDHFAEGLLGRLPRLDVIVNNAAQTIRRPPAFYQNLVEEELSPTRLPPLIGKLVADSDSTPLSPASPNWAALPALRTQVSFLPGDEQRNEAYFPTGWLDADGQQLDLRPLNSWIQTLAEVTPLELLEVHAINALAPFLLLRRLDPLFRREPGQPKHIVNVSAMEGQFNGAFKTGCHPHTNMAKAGLNMITRTCAASYAERGIYLNSVDTGWITNEAPHPRAERMASEGFREPLDAIDGAARVLDPIFVGFVTGRHPFGQFWKDYRPISW